MCSGFRVDFRALCGIEGLFPPGRAQRHQRSPGFKPGNWYIGMGVMRSLPREQTEPQGLLRHLHKQNGTSSRRSWPPVVAAPISIRKPRSMGSVLQTSSSVFRGKRFFGTGLFFSGACCLLLVDRNPRLACSALLRRKSIENPLGFHAIWLARTSGVTNEGRFAETSDASVTSCESTFAPEACFADGGVGCVDRISSGQIVDLQFMRVLCHF